MDHNVDNLIEIEKEIQLKVSESNNMFKIPTIIAVSKTFSISDILPVINYGQIHFGENKIQEAIDKWESIKIDFKHIKLHMVGKLQTNKVKYLIPFFDYLHSLDNIKLAQKISSEQKKKNKKLKIFIQVNIGSEQQKNGIEIDQVENFYNKCTNELELDIVGLMCLPPNNEKSSLYFSKMNMLAKKLNLSELSMGMSNDYIEALENNSSFLRIGSKIFGPRD
jgi:pyridoxal phosphate enzyme (YggS family)